MGLLTASCSSHWLVFTFVVISMRPKKVHVRFIGSAGRLASRTRRRLVDLDCYLSAVRLHPIVVIHALAFRLRSKRTRLSALKTACFAARPFCAFLILGLTLLNAGSALGRSYFQMFLTAFCVLHGLAGWG